MRQGVCDQNNDTDVSYGVLKHCWLCSGSQGSDRYKKALVAIQGLLLLKPGSITELWLSYADLPGRLAACLVG
jgi:hypothetical protein